MSGYEIDSLTPRKASKSKILTPRQEMNTIAETEGDHQEGLQTSADIVEIETEFIQEEAPHPTTSKHVINPTTISKYKSAAKISKISTKNSLEVKASLKIFCSL